jgi:hypothetical protein
MSHARLLPALALAAAAVAAVPVLPAAAAPAGAPAAAPADSKPAEPVGEWLVGPVVDPKGEFLYCVSESRYNNGQSLVIGRSPREEINLAIGTNGGTLIQGQGSRVKISVDGELNRSRQAFATQPDLLVIANGPDRELVDALEHGKLLVIEGPKDSIGFVLKGTGKAMRDLRTCVAEARSGKPVKPLGRVEADGSPTTLPPRLRELLAEAGFKKVDLLALKAAPVGFENAQAVWRSGGVVAGVQEAPAEADKTLPGLSEALMLKLRTGCGAAYEPRWTDPEVLAEAALRLGSTPCLVPGKDKQHLSLLVFLTRNGLFTSFFFLAPDREAATRDRDAVAKVVRKAAVTPPAAAE